MPLKLSPPVIETFELEKSDKLFDNQGDPTIVKIRQATNGEEEQRDKLLSLVEKRYEQSSIVFVSSLGYSELHREEVFLTLAECNIEKEDGTPLFEFKDKRLDDKTAFLKAWARLQPEIAAEIIEKVHEVNLQWGPQGNK